MNFLHGLLLLIAPGAWAQLCEHDWADVADHHVDGVPYLQAKDNTEPPSLEIRPLIVNGPSGNRVDIIFLGDGYTDSQKEKFFEDSMFLAHNITHGDTFADVLPFMNFWAGFSPSAEIKSGIGVGGQPKDTIYGLYRTGTELRGVVSSKPNAIRAACHSTELCDYPIVLGNDPYYGGMGGKFIIVTASPNNGPSILRHEMGHTLIDIGEEYDGGFNYSGVNSAKDVLPVNVPWAHWYTDQSSEVRQRTIVPTLVYPWKSLDYSVRWSHTFTSAGTYSSYAVHFSVSGVAATGDLSIDMDGSKLDWEANDNVGLDRWIYRIKINKPLMAGTHDLGFTLLNRSRQGSAQLCHVEVIEFGTEDEFATKAGYYGLYPTFDSSNQTTYRPTNELCIMRDMHSTTFCSVCMEGLWLRLLGRPISFIDGITQSKGNDGATFVTLELLPLAEFRKVPTSREESFSIFWYDDTRGALLADWTNSTSALLPKNMEKFSIEVRFSTEQVRLDTEGLLVQRTNYIVEEDAPSHSPSSDWQGHLFRA